MTHCLQLQGFYSYFICCACENSAQVINSSLNLPSLFPAFPPHSCLLTTLHREGRRPFSIVLFLEGNPGKSGGGGPVDLWFTFEKNMWRIFSSLLNCISTRFLSFSSFHLGAIKQIWINRWVYILNESRIGVCLLQPQTPGNVPGT